MKVWQSKLYFIFVVYPLIILTMMSIAIVTIIDYLKGREFLDKLVAEMESNLRRDELSRYTEQERRKKKKSITK